jgi:hypothetical protein
MILPLKGGIMVLFTKNVDGFTPRARVRAW